MSTLAAQVADEILRRQQQPEEGTRFLELPPPQPEIVCGWCGGKHPESSCTRRRQAKAWEEAKAKEAAAKRREARLAKEAAEAAEDGEKK